MILHEMSVLHEKTGDNICIHSPAIGYVSDLPLPGQVISSGTCIGRLQVLGCQYILKLPPAIAGKVADYDTEEKVKPVGYGQSLFTLVPILSDALASGTEKKEEMKQNGTKTQGQFVVKSPTDGILYRRPSPDSPYYVDVGTVIKKGQVLGLVEVMKCFNQITFAGIDFPEQAKVVEICVTDATEVKYQQPLFILEVA